MSYAAKRTTESLDFVRTARLQAGLRYLAASQAIAAPVAGAWPAHRHERRQVRTDYTCFTTCLIYSGLTTLATRPALRSMEQAHVRQLVRRGVEFIETCQAVAPMGAYRFWHPAQCALPGPDLDDTALAYLALSAAGVTRLDELEALQLFAPYRVHRAALLHPLSQWAARHPGVFAVWMDDAPAIVDACVCANIVRYLARANLRTTPGYRASLRLVTQSLTGRRAAFEHSPYYRSTAALAFLCSLISFPAASERWIEEEMLIVALRATVEANLVRSAPTLYENLLWLNAAHNCGLPLPPPTLDWTLEQQRGDGSWAAGTICYDLHGLMYWTSAAVTTTLALLLTTLE